MEASLDQRGCREAFGADYVRDLRQQAAGYRVRVRSLEADVDRLEAENARLRASKRRLSDRLGRALETNKRLLGEGRG